jgi:hypothetical protein
LYDAINSTAMGGCSNGFHVAGWEGACDRKHLEAIVPAAQLMSFSLVFPNLKMFMVIDRVFRLNVLSKVTECKDWVEYVKMRERDGVEVVEVESAVP